MSEFSWSQTAQMRDKVHPSITLGSVDLESLTLYRNEGQVDILTIAWTSDLQRRAKVKTYIPTLQIMSYMYARVLLIIIEDYFLPATFKLFAFGSING